MHVALHQLRLLKPCTAVWTSKTHLVDTMAELGECCIEICCDAATDRQKREGTPSRARSFTEALRMLPQGEANEQLVWIQQDSQVLTVLNPPDGEMGGAGLARPSATSSPWLRSCTITMSALFPSMALVGHSYRVE